MDNAKLKEVLESWLGTPFRHRCGVKGLGADCIHFVARVLQEMGILQWRADMIPDYPPDWHMHSTREILREGILKYLHVKEITFHELQNGDLIQSHFGLAASHAAIYCDGYVYQALNDIGVVKTSVHDRATRRQMKYFYRILS